MKLKKKPKPGQCYAKPCTATEALVERDGALLCQRHVTEPIEAPAPPSAEAAALVPVEVKATVAAPIEVEALALRDRLASTTIVIRTPEELAAAPGTGITLDQAGALAAFVQQRITATKAARQRVTGHLTAAKREMDSWFLPSVQAFEQVKTAVHAAMTTFTTAQSQARRAALDAGDHATAMAAAPAALPAGTHERKRVLWRVTDMTAVPREFMCVDGGRVGAIVDQQGMQTAIPGIEVYESTTLVTRGA